MVNIGSYLFVLLIFMIAIIYLFRVIRKKSELPQSKPYKFPKWTFVEILAIIFFGAIDIPNISLPNRLLFFGVGTIGLTLFGVYDYRKNSPKKPKQAKTSAVKTKQKPRITNPPSFWQSILRLCIDVFAIGTGTGASYIFWNTVTVRQIPVLTYSDALSLVFLVIVGFFGYDLVRNIYRMYLNLFSESTEFF